VNKKQLADDTARRSPAVFGSSSVAQWLADDEPLMAEVSSSSAVQRQPAISFGTAASVTVDVVVVGAKELYYRCRCADTCLGRTRHVCLFFLCCRTKVIVSVQHDVH
jgi:hypothetical protein